MNQADVFVLTATNGILLPPAIQATALAKYSRSPLPMREIVNSITAEEAEEFQNKWGVKYGHSSIAELATLPFCFEGVSIVASKVLEKHQRGAYSEKSTRYQEFSANSFVSPIEGNETPPSVRKLYDTYAMILPKMQEHVGKKMMKDGTKVITPTTIKGRAFDAIRYLLPAGTGTSLAAVWNARDARYVMNDLLSHPLPELQSIGKKMMAAAHAVAPVFTMGVKPTEHRSDIFWPRPRTQQHAETPGVRIINHNGTNIFWEVANQYGIVGDVGLDVFMNQRGKEQPPPECFRSIRLMVELTMDYGAFRDLQRHRRCDQFVSPLDTEIGYVVPDDLLDADGEVLDAYHEAMRGARSYALEVVQKTQRLDPKSDVLTSQYNIPLGFMHRSIFSMDLQELYYIAELRTQPQGHISYRRIAYQMFEAAKQAFPMQMKWCRAIAPDVIGHHA